MFLYLTKLSFLKTSTKQSKIVCFKFCTFLSLSFPPLLPVLEVLPLDGDGALFNFANLRLPPDDSLVAPKSKFHIYKPGLRLNLNLRFEHDLKAMFLHVGRLQRNSGFSCVKVLQELFEAANTPNDHWQEKTVL